MKNSENSPGATWILLRGLARERAHWGSFPAEFAARFPNDEVLCVDLPGAGEFANMTCPTDVTSIWAAVRAAAVEKARTQAPFKIVALSLGAMVAIEWMRQKPTDLAGCVLINTSLRSTSRFYHRLRWQVWGDFLKLVSASNAREREKMLIDVLINDENKRALALPLWTKIAQERPVSYLNMANQLMAAVRFQGMESAPAVPVTLLCGLGDRMVDPSCTLDLARKWNCPVHTHPWAGHDLPWDVPEWLLDQVQQIDLA